MFATTSATTTAPAAIAGGAADDGYTGYTANNGTPGMGGCTAIDVEDGARAADARAERDVSAETNIMYAATANTGNTCNDVTEVTRHAAASDAGAVSTDVAAMRGNTVTRPTPHH